MTRLNTLLAHPDPEVRQRLRRMLASVPFLRVLGEAVDGEEAWALLDALPYGVFFTGVDLGGETSGMELARRLLGRRDRPALVFIAGDEKLAFEAFDLDATDYLIFPCPDERFQRTVGRLDQFRANFRLAPEPAARWREPHQAQPPQQPQADQPAPQPAGGPAPSQATPALAAPSAVRAAIASGDIEPLGSWQDGWHEEWRDDGHAPGNPEDGPPVQTLQLALGDEEQDSFLSALGSAWDYTSRFRPVEIGKLAITQDGTTILVPYNEIVFVEAYEDYSYVHTSTDKYLTSYRLKVLEGRLRPHRFFRVHRKYLVNLDMVTEIASVPGGNCMLRTMGRTRIELPISRRRLGELKEILGL
ncbi:LytR/AlgR family response regulator transcription factor [Nitratidesulfovibrio sp. SRB-5]|uniref:LytR/AlgR family response regulator transcription factor n=1 Tax=Nitratidesulfovibrio sp. SRB-5 TaxID=2872636 RepID=UPI0010250740|nr:LytTR family DNA-binding domain-containing protein [Nitratidesulfovibrio sp. SRB-5]MBZ2170956.1 LytTR family DNA-binding domain-containing protein [Nitratidesulfovibrio sp. SRB-5]RXF76154.1 response regulator transcription factor [Desulfovibrio sp. DS-1]